MEDLLHDAAVLAARVRTSGALSLVADAERQGVAGLLAYRAGADTDPELNALRRRLMLEEELRVAEMRRVIDALGAACVRAVILKGSALAYTHYPEPWCRTRADLDLLVARADRTAAGRVLQAAGYAPGDLISGTWLMQQDLWERELAPGATQMVDVHVEFTNRAFFATHFPAADGLAHAVPAPFAGPHGWQLDPADALIFSCVHRVAHHSGDARLIWSRDLALQADACSSADVMRVVARARTHGLSAICAQELTLARAIWGGRSGAFANDVLAELDDAGRSDASRAFLAGGRGPARDLWLDLRALPSWGARAELLIEHLFPPRAFMLRQPGATRGNLAWRYARRILAGPFKWGRSVIRP
jgi:hypothetical protein